MIDTYAAKVVTTFLSAALLGLSATVMDNRVDNSRQDAEIANIGELKDKVELFNEQISTANVNLATLNERLRTDE